MKVEKIKAEIETLSREDFVRLREWFAERDWEQWDNKLEEDIAAGKLDFLLEEAKKATIDGKLKEL